MHLKTYHTQINLDTLTPVSAYLRIRDVFANSILLESSDYNSKEGNYSFIACKPVSSFKMIGEEIQIANHQCLKRNNARDTDFKKQLTSFIHSFEIEAIDVQFPYSAVFGYSSFDSISCGADIRFKALNISSIPTVYYSLYSLLIVFDHSKNQLHIVSLAETKDQANQSAHKLIELLSHHNTPDFTFESIGNPIPYSTDENYLEMVEIAKQHCRLGDVFQLVLSRRFKQSFTGDEFNVYRALKQINPSPYLFFFDFGSFKLFGSSPEAQLVVKNQKAEIYPIAGTYKRTQNPEDDIINAQQLGEDPKENSEHTMLVDLARNDLSICCTDVKVESLKQAQFYSDVIHLVSKVTGKLKPLCTPIDLLYHSFPAGTLSGAPKHKALELIQKYECTPRNFYGGCIGYLEMNGNINHAIMIRSFLSTHNQIDFQAGAGITIGSKPENELEEINHKISPLKKALKEANKLNIIVNFTKDETSGTR